MSLSRATLIKTSLEKADLRSANFQAAKFGSTILKGANLSGAVFWKDEKDGYEEERGLKLADVWSADKWELAHFSHDFKSKLDAGPVDPST